MFRLIFFVFVSLHFMEANASSMEIRQSHKCNVEECNSESVSMVALISNPNYFHGKRVLTSGYLVLENENKSVFLTREHAENFVFTNSIWLDEDGWLRNLIGINKKYCLLEGLFDSSLKGHSDLASGTLKDISRVMCR